jgi:hypothetical protein
VGRVAARRRAFARSESPEASRDIASAIPKAAATPMSGAPRTRIVSMASATASGESSERVSKACGSRVWSMMCTGPPGLSAQRLR